MSFFDDLVKATKTATGTLVHNIPIVGQVADYAKAHPQQTQDVARGAVNVLANVVAPPIVGAGEVFNRDINAPIQAGLESAGQFVTGKPVTYGANYNKAANTLTESINTSPGFLDKLAGTKTQPAVTSAYEHPAQTAALTALTALAPELKLAGTAGKAIEAGVGAGFGAQAASQIPAEVKNIQNLKGSERTQAITEAILNTALATLGTASAVHGGIEVGKAGIEGYKANPVLSSEGGYIAGPGASFFDSVAPEKKFVGPEGQARIEVTDANSKAKSVDQIKPGATLPDVLQHPTLYQDYPQFKDIKVNVDPNLKANDRGSFDPNTNTITLNAGHSSAAAVKDTLLHEVQHGIQTTEGFAPGASSEAYDKAKLQVNRLQSSVDRIQKDITQKNYGTIKPGETLNGEQRLTEMKTELADKQAKLEAARTNRDQIYQDYHKTAGEAESRAVSARSGMDQAALDKTNPYDKQYTGVPQKDLVVTKPTGGTVAGKINPEDQVQFVSDLAKQKGVDLPTLASEITDHKTNLMRTELQNMVDEAKAGGITQGALHRNADGEVVGRTGRTSTNPDWYKQLYQEGFNKTRIESAVRSGFDPLNPKTDLQKRLVEVVDQRLTGNYTDKAFGNIPANAPYVGANRALDAIKEAQKAVSTTKEAAIKAVTGGPAKAAKTPAGEPVKVKVRETKPNPPTFKEAKATLHTLTHDDPFIDHEQATPTASEGKQYPGRGTVDLSKLINPDTQKAVRDGLITKQAAAETAGAAVKREFSDLKGTKFSDFAKEYQSGAPKVGRAADVAKLLDDQAKKEKAAGISYGIKEDYLPTSGLWQESADQVRKTLGEEYLKNIQTHPGFAEHSVLKDIQMGLDKGLHLKTQNIPEILAARIEAGDKAIAAKNFFDSEIETGRISPDYKRGMKEIGTTGYFAQPEYAKVLNNYLGGYSGILRKTANAASYLKRIVFTGAGVPGTGFVPHGLNEFVDFMKSYPNSHSIPLTGKLQALVRGLYDMARPATAARSVDLGLIEEAQKAGSYFTLKTKNTLGQEFAAEGRGGLISRAGKAADKLRKATYETPLFEGTIPAMKSQILEARFNELMNKGIDRPEALRQAGNYAMDALGEINYDYIMRNKDFQAAVASTVFAPTFNEAHIKEVALNIPKAFTTELGNPEFKVYRRAATSIAAGVVALDLLQRAVSGHGLAENKNNKGLNLELTVNGQIVDIPIFGSFYSNTLGSAIQAGVNAATTGDLSGFSQIARNRLSGPAALMVSALTNTNNYGQAITSTKNTPGQNAQNAISAITSGITPPAVSSAVQYATGQTSGASALARGTGTPISIPRASKGRSRRVRSRGRIRTTRRSTRGTRRIRIRRA